MASSGLLDSILAEPVLSEVGSPFGIRRTIKWNGKVLNPE